MKSKVVSLALLALIVGGCSLLVIVGTLYECANNNYESCFYLKIVSSFAVPSLVARGILGNWAWRAHKGKRWRTIDYLLLALVPIFGLEACLLLLVLMVFSVYSGNYDPDHNAPPVVTVLVAIVCTFLLAIIWEKWRFR